MSARRWCMHALFACTECDAAWQDYRDAAEQAAKHARDTGHEVHGELGYAVRYNEKRRSDDRQH